MGRKILAIVVALITAIMIMLIIEMLNSLQIAPPAEVWTDRNRLLEFMANAPAQVYVVVLFGYILASFAGGFIVTKMSRQVSSGTSMPLIVGVILTLLAVVNFVIIPGQPIWFMALSILSFIPLSLVGHRFAR